MTTKTAQRIDAVLELYQGKGFRRHLGASLIGRPCVRQLWYVFRWATRSQHKGRILRLFSRGDDEENRFTRFLRGAGIHVLDVNPETGKQFRISDHEDHFGGSLDAKLFDTPDFRWIWVLGEFKTHNDKSFKDLKRKGVRKSKWEHFVQSQIYMSYEDLPACLYFAVNKNDDEMHIEVIEPEQEVVDKHIDRAHRVIYSEVPPPRIENASPAWYVCRWCDFKQVCHNGVPKEKNCRTCVFSSPDDNGTWFCGKFHVDLDYAAQLKGCIEHKEIPET